MYSGSTIVPSPVHRNSVNSTNDDGSHVSLQHHDIHNRGNTHGAYPPNIVVPVEGHGLYVNTHSTPHGKTI